MTLGSVAPEPLPGLAPKDRIAQEFEAHEAISVDSYAAIDNVDFQHYLEPDRWQPTVNWLRAKRIAWQEKRTAFANHFVDMAELKQNSGRKGLILAGCITVGALVAVAAPNAEELHEQRSPAVPATSPETTYVTDDCAARVSATVKQFPEYADETPLLLSHCRDGQSLVIETMINAPTSSQPQN